MVMAALPILLVVAACGTSADWGSGPDVSHSGQIVYACALAQHVDEEYGAPSTWSDWVGDDADPGVHQVASAGSLLGGTGGFTVPDHKELSDAGKDIITNVMSADVEKLDTALDDVIAACENVSESGDPDVSDSGQITYACAIANHIDEEHGTVDTWGDIGEERAWHEAGSFASLVGAINGQVLSDHAELSELGKDVFAGVSKIEKELLQNALDDVLKRCENV